MLSLQRRVEMRLLHRGSGTLIIFNIKILSRKSEVVKIRVTSFKRIIQSLKLNVLPLTWCRVLKMSLAYHEEIQHSPLKYRSSHTKIDGYCGFISDKVLQGTIANQTHNTALNVD